MWYVEGSALGFPSPPPLRVSILRCGKKKGKKRKISFAGARAQLSSSNDHYLNLTWRPALSLVYVGTCPTGWCLLPRRHTTTTTTATATTTALVTDYHHHPSYVYIHRHPRSFLAIPLLPPPPPPPRLSSAVPRSRRGSSKQCQPAHRS